MIIEPEADKKFVERMHPLTPDFEAMLLRVPEDEREGRVLAFTLPRSKPDKPPRLDTISKKIVEIGRAANIVVNSHGKFASAHDLRRTFGDRWSKRVKAIQLKRLMRHESLETTEKYYLGHDAAEFMDEMTQQWGDT